MKTNTAHFTSLLIACVTLGPAVAPRLPAADLVWTNLNGGAWASAANWSPNQVPVSSDNVFITNSGTYSVSLAANTAVINLTFGAGILTGPGHLAVNGTMDWSGGVVSGPDTASLDMNGSLLITATNQAVRLSGRRLNNAGTVTWSAGQFNTDAGTVISNQVGAIFDIAANLSFAGSRVFYNSGTVRRSAGAGLATINSVFHNHGVVEVQTGTLSLTGGGVHTGSFAPATGGTVSFVAVATNTHTFGSTASVQGAGNAAFSGIGTNISTVDFDGTYGIRGATTFGSGITFNFNPQATVATLGSNLTVNGGTVNLNSGDTLVTTNLFLTGGTLAGSDNLTVTGSMIWNNNAVTGSGAINLVNTNGTLLINGPVSLDGRTLNNAGQTTWSAGQINTGNGSVINNLTDGRWITTFDGVISNAFGGSSAFHNAGSFTKSGGTSASLVIDPFSNSGTVHAQSGVLVFTGLYTQTAGATLLEGGDIFSVQPMQIQAGLLSGVGTVYGSVTNAGRIQPGSVAGTLIITGDFTQTSAGALDVDLVALVLSQYRVAVGGNATLSGALNVSLTNGYPVSIACTTNVFLTYGASSGPFTSFNFPSNLVGLNVRYDLTAASIEVINVAPVISAIPDQVTDELVPHTYQVVAADFDCPPQTLTYQLLQSPIGAAINLNTGLFTWTPAEGQGPGTHTIDVWVVDNGMPPLSATQSFSMVVREVNLTPVWDPIPTHVVNELTTLAIGLTNFATDPDLPTNLLTFELVSVTNLDGLLTITNVMVVNGALIWPITEEQGPSTNLMEVKVTDTNLNDTNVARQHLSATNFVTVIVNEVNQPPVLNGWTTNFDELVTNVLWISASDSEIPIHPMATLGFAVLSYTSNGVAQPPGNFPTLVETNATNAFFTWYYPEAGGPSTNLLTVSVTDTNLLDTNVARQHLSATNTFTMIINESNQPPTLLLPVTNIVFISDQDNTILIPILDPDLPPNTFQISQLIKSNVIQAIFTVQGTNLVIIWDDWFTPQGYALPPSPITITIEDTNLRDTNTARQHLTFTTNFTIEVVGGGLYFVTPYTNGVDELTPFFIAATNSPPTVLTYSIQQNPDNLVTVYTNNSLLWTPTEAHGRLGTNYTIRVRVDEPGPAHATRTFTIFVNESNSPPTLAPIADRTINASQPLSITNVATDTDIPTNLLTFSLINSPPPGAAINSASGVFTWTPSGSQADTNYGLTVVVTDSNTNDTNVVRQQLGATNSFTITVSPTNVLLSALLISPDYSNLVLSVRGPTGSNYFVEATAATNDFSQSNWNWVSFYTNLAANTPFVITNLIDTNSGAKFYRVRPPP